MHTPTRTLLSASAAATLLLLSARPIDAHHSAAIFDTSHTVNLSGTIQRFEATNPHSQIYIEIESADGTATLWSPYGNHLCRDEHEYDLS